MPVLLDRGESGHLVLGSQRKISASDFVPSRGIDIALINNMPDGALEATERQFAELLAAASGDRLIRLKLFSLPDVARAKSARRYVDETYSSIDGLWTSRPDGLIVTGTEPRAAALTDEPYWSALTQIVDWAQYTTVSTIWSCLAAHAAVLHMDGIHRRPLGEKRSGVFKFTSKSDHPLVAGIPRRFAIPHSRYNDLDHNELAACGYTILSRSEQAGIDTFVKQKRSTFVFFQGHPEYEPETLFREYRRDVARFLKGERTAYPAMPEQYFAEGTRNRLIAFREHALVARSESLLADFPAVETELTSTWRTAATCIYRNWLNAIFAEKERRPNPMTRIPSHRAVNSAAPNGSPHLIAIEGDRTFSLPTAGSGVAGRAPERSRVAMGTPAGRPKA
jgi:homoserine O-succinyltransferase/O-acetyltransferase